MKITLYDNASRALLFSGDREAARRAGIKYLPSHEFAIRGEYRRIVNGTVYNDGTLAFWLSSPY